ncbi:hypothetical protein D3C86_1123690 [compost metagenome]
MAPRDVVVEADQRHRNAQERGAAHVELARNGELRLVEAVGPAPVPVRVAEQQRARVAGGGGAEADHVAAHALFAADLQGHGEIARGELQPRLLLLAAGAACRDLRRRRGHGRGRVRDVRQEVAVAARQVGRVHAAVDVLGGDRLHPGFGAAGRVRAATGLRVAQVAVVAGGEALHQSLHVVGLRADHLLQHVGRDDVAVEEVGVDVLRQADGAAGHELRVGAEVLRALAAVGEERVGHGAQVVLGLRVAVAVAQVGPVGGLDVRHAHRGAADLGLVGVVLCGRIAARAGEEGKAAAATASAATAGGQCGCSHERKPE